MLIFRCWFFIFILLQGANALALEVGAGLSAIEEGDDRLRPGVLAHVSDPEIGFVRLHHYGRTFGPIVERSYIISANRELDILRSLGNEILYAGLGFAALIEQTQIRVQNDSVSEMNYNLGFNVGAYARIPLPQPMFMKIGWESHIFPAGFASILLSNGRKQVISLVTGVSF
jgi:hypothetical protein